MLCPCIRSKSNFYSEMSLIAIFSISFIYDTFQVFRRMTKFDKMTCHWKTHVRLAFWLFILNSCLSNNSNVTSMVLFVDHWCITQHLLLYYSV